MASGKRDRAPGGRRGAGPGRGPRFLGAFSLVRGGGAIGGPEQARERAAPTPRIPISSVLTLRDRWRSRHSISFRKRPGRVSVPGVSRLGAVHSRDADRIRRGAHDGVCEDDHGARGADRVLDVHPFYVGTVRTSSLAAGSSDRCGSTGQADLRHGIRRDGAGPQVRPGDAAAVARSRGHRSTRSGGLPPVPKPVHEAPSGADPCGMARSQPFGPVRVAMPAESLARRDWPVSALRRGILIDVAAPGC